MIWLFQRHGEYLACEVRTCLENAGFELLTAGSSRREVEWFPSERELEARWEALRRQLECEGWGELYITIDD
jgi:hypothetical protein